MVPCTPTEVSETAKFFLSTAELGFGTQGVEAWRPLGRDPGPAAPEARENMGLVGGIWLLLLGVLAAPSLLLSKRPDAAQALAKIAPYQGWFGAVSTFWGLWGIISALLNVKLIQHVPIWWFTALAVSALLASLGLLLGVGVLKTFIKEPTAVAKMDETIARLAPKQGQLGLVAIGLGIWGVIASFIW